jgi:hypothetical protein
VDALAALDHEFVVRTVDEPSTKAGLAEIATPR